jgi:hypothetical protein
MLRAVWAGLVPLSACFSIVFMARKASLEIKVEENLLLI